jgi:hypothetical protein
MNESMLSSAGHIALDLIGVIPGAGEIADVTNASWYIKEGDYISAALSLISTIPELGDLIGKGGKVSLWLTKFGKTGKLAKATASTLVKLANLIQQHSAKITVLLKSARKNKVLGPHVEKLNSALKEFVTNAHELLKTVNASQRNADNKDKSLVTKEDSTRKD